MQRLGCGDQKVLGKTAFVNLLWEKSGYVNACFLDIKRLYSAWVADAANFHGSQVSKHPCLFARIYTFQCPANISHTHLIILKCA